MASTSQLMDHNACFPLPVIRASSYEWFLF
jgi:hypothetical protein